MDALIDRVFDSAKFRGCETLREGRVTELGLRIHPTKWFFFNQARHVCAVAHKVLEQSNERARTYRNGKLGKKGKTNALRVKERGRENCARGPRP
jgi:hypothetical protein